MDALRGAETKRFGEDLIALTRRVFSGDPHANREMAEFVREVGDVSTLAQRSAPQTARELAGLPPERGDLTSLVNRAESDESEDPAAGAALRLALLLRWQGKTISFANRPGQLRAWLLYERGDLASLISRADPYAAERLAWLLGEVGDAAALTDRGRSGDEFAARVLEDLRTARGVV